MRNLTETEYVVARGADRRQIDIITDGSDVIRVENKGLARFRIEAHDQRVDEVRSESSFVQQIGQHIVQNERLQLALFAQFVEIGAEFQSFGDGLNLDASE